ncbi:tetratricopeptide repeat protein [Tenacibaculum sp. UWU-22]|uniref:tetratricopeptide repeat protein n=1 Tax=Tenacibaculum sp. UWU-22 TaxID=3234187 RepID=UPI0034DB5D8C
MKSIFSKKNHSFFFSFFFLFILAINAQETEIQTNLVAQYHHAVQLYNNKAYAAAQTVFSDVSKNIIEKENLQTNADYYDAMCAVKLNQPDADAKVIAFVKKHPNSTKKELAYLQVGNYYFANKKVAQALKWYAKVDENLLNIEDRNTLNFKMGYALLVSGHENDAQNKFKQLLNDARYGNDARYYYGYIAYKKEDYNLAQKTLTEIADVAAYKTKATYYLLDISFKAGHFDKCIELGKKLLPKANLKERSEISKIIGESYFNLQKYAEAIPYLKAYKGKNRRWNNTDYYQLGYALFKQNDFANAVAYFNKIIDQKDVVSQNAYYQLGDCYLKLNKKPEALNAFKSASEMGFDEKVKQDAALNYAKLSYEEGNPYKSIPEVLQTYLKNYPNSSHTTEIKELLITSYLYQQDYQGALDYLNKVAKNKENISLKNEVALYRGIQLFNKKQLSKALLFFETATQSSDSAIKNKAVFWLAETQYRLNNYNKALTEFLLVNSNEFDQSDLLNYHIAYCYFKLKNYSKAIQYFKQYTQQKNIEANRFNDAFLRLGDSYYASKNYASAIDAYTKVIATNAAGADYALYQKAMSNGLTSDYEKKISNLLTVVNEYPNSSLKDDALFQIGLAYTTLKNHAKADQAYNRLILNHPKSGYIPNVLLRQGLLFYTDNDNNNALKKFKEIVAKYPNSSEAKQAVTNARNVYIDMGKVDQYALWVKSIPFINVSDADLDNATYESAENKFLEDNTEKAIEGFRNYLQKFSNGLHALQAHFYLAQSYNKSAQAENSIPHYTYVVEQNQNEFTEEALTKLSEIYLKKEDWNKAKPLLQRLEQEANYEQNKVYAQSNLMTVFYTQKNYKKAVTYAQKVIASSAVEKRVKADAKIVIARSAFKTKDFSTAQTFFSKVEQTAIGELKAETLYYNAFFKHVNKEYEASNKVVQQLISDYSAYKYWGVKSYIIMAKNYYELKDVYQATYILENIIKNFAQYQDVVEEAQTELQKIKVNEAKTNESVNPEK